MDFNIKENISTEQKVDLVGLTIQESFFDGIVNPMLLELFFAVNVVLVYSDIAITEEEKTDKLALFDKFSSDIFNSFNEKIKDKYPDDMKNLWTYVEKWSKAYQEYQNSFVGIVDKLKDFGNQLIDKTGEGVSLLESLNPDSLQQIVDVAQGFGINFNKKNNETIKTVEID